MPCADLPIVLAQAAVHHEPHVFSSIPWFAWIAIVAIVSGFSAVIVGVVIRHRERMAMIRMGLHPDHPPDAEHDAKPLAREACDF